MTGFDKTILLGMLCGMTAVMSLAVSCETVLINIPTGIFIKKFENLYKDTFNMLISNNLIDKHIISEMTNMRLDFNQEKLEITPLGKEIIDICLS